MEIEDIKPKKNNEYILEIVQRLGLEVPFYLSAEEINTIVSEIKKLKEDSGADIDLEGFIKKLEYKEESNTIQYEVEGYEGFKVITLLPKDLEERVNELDFDESIAKPYERYLEFSKE